MNNFKSSVLLIFYLANFSNVFAQANLLNAVVPQEIGQLNEQQLATSDNEPLAYGYVDDRDVMWSKTIWEKIDLDERINFPFYYPVENVDPTRKPLFDVLLEAIKAGSITEVYTDGYFRNKKSLEEIEETLFVQNMTEQGTDKYNAGEELTEEDYVSTRVTAYDIKEYWIKGTWYFDKRLGELKYRMLGIAPISPDVNFIKDYEKNQTSDDQQEFVELFWVWFPSAREALNNSEIFNSRNASQPVTFDLMLNSRRFNSIIFKEENPYNDREIKEYIYEDALRQLLESERIKNVIRDYEQDMWNN
jgi:gliding motility associated protien GldN|tara:strand:- start:1341 stop:2252 length:912 start_codon:yes stop_codon:yes gene_type:complete